MNSASATTPIDAPAVQQAFDQAAPSYDRDWNQSIIGRHQRQAVWDAIDPLFTEGDRVLDIGCGTGVDALHFAERGIRVHATDISPAMIEQLNQHVAQRSIRTITAEALSIEDLDELAPEEPFDGAYSNFSPLNCVEYLEPVADSLARLIRPGGKLALCVMTRFCLWETLWYPLTAQLYKAARRWRSNNVTATVSSSGEFDVFYHSAHEIEAALSEHFRRIGDRGVGIFVPPSYLEPWAERFPRTVAGFAAIDRVVNRWPLFRSIGDHRLLVFQRQ